MLDERFLFINVLIILGVKNEKLKASDIRQKYIDFFVEKGHMVEPSAPLVPIDDDSLLWINSGVATLKNTLMDEKHLKSLE